MSYLQAIFGNIATRFWRWKFRIRNSYPMDRMSSTLQWRLLKFNCCLLCLQAAVFCYFLFSKRHFVLRASSPGRGVTSRLIFLIISYRLWLLHKQHQGLQIFVVIYHLALPRSMHDRGERTNLMKSASFVETLAYLIHFSLKSSSKR